MLRTILAAAALALTAGLASAQGAADVGDYHERFVRDADPTDEATGFNLFDAFRDPPEQPGVEETIVIRRSPATIERAPAAIPEGEAGTDRD